MAKSQCLFGTINIVGGTTMNRLNTTLLLSSSPSSRLSRAAPSESASEMVFAVSMAFDMNHWFSEQITLNITEFKETSAWIG